MAGLQQQQQLQQQESYLQMKRMNNRARLLELLASHDDIEDSMSVEKLPAGTL